ncbi:MAG TPA: DPP IV N-terminal domain-containing protein [Vicinamibacterales bacterium]|nr:DPP IV N-terminal domain-containing protein [Vicinamibacterales bacterium]
MTICARRSALALAWLAACAPAASAQVTAADYERAAALREKWEGLVVHAAGPATWIENTHRFYYRRSVKGGHEFVLVDADTLERRPPFDHEKLAAALSKAAGERYTALRLPFDTFRFVDDGRAIQATFGGAAWRCTLDEYRCERRGADGGFQGWGNPNGPVRDPDAPRRLGPWRSPDGRWEAVIHNYNLGVRPAGGGEFVLLSTDGSEGDYYDGASLAWAPDSRKLAIFRVRPGYHRRIHFVESSPADQIQPKAFSRLYPKPGDVLDLEQPVLFDVDGRRQIAIDRALFPNPYDLSNPVWRKDSRAFTFEYNQRGHQVYRVIEVDAATGRARAVVSEEAKTFFYYTAASDSPGGGGKRFRHDLDDGREIVWMSERDGWNHLYLYDGATGTVKNQITRGEWVVRAVVKVDEQARQVWFVASGMDAGKDPYYRYYFRVNLDGTGLTRLTEAEGNHVASFSSDMTYYVDLYSRLDLPPVLELRRTADNSLVKVLERADASELLKAGWKPPEVFVAKGRDGRTDIWGIIVRPANFDPSRKYPVVEQIYAGPQGSFVPKSFTPYTPMHALAELGFVVVQIDGMGTSNRSKAFHDVAWKNLKDAGFPDRILWHRAVAAKYPWYDISRVGIYGNSAGGQNALGALLFHPEFYKAAVSSAGCHDNRMDKLWWNELWMGWPIGPHYAESSNVDNAWRLQGRLLLVVGELDTNVDPASTFQVVNQLIKHDKVFDLLVIPGGGHGHGGAYGERKRWDFFVQHLLGQTPPDWNRRPLPKSTTTEPSPDEGPWWE